MKRRERRPVVTVRSDVHETTQPPEVSKQVVKALRSPIACLPSG